VLLVFIPMETSVKSYVYTSALLFVVFLIFGMIFTQLYPEAAAPVVSDMATQFEPLVKSSPPEIFTYIFINNSLIDLLAILTFFVFGLGSLYFIVSNGFIIGLVVDEALKKASLIAVIATLLPHGIFELPSFFIATGYGLWLGVQFSRHLFFKRPFKPSFFRAMKIYISVVLLLNFVAAMIEVFITPMIYSSVK